MQPNETRSRFLTLNGFDVDNCIAVFEEVEESEMSESERMTLTKLKAIRKMQLGKKERNERRFQRA